MFISNNLRTCPGQGRTTEPQGGTGGSAAREDLVCEFSLRCEREAVPVSREITRRRLNRWACGGEAVEAACLVVSELVTNAVVHSGGTHIDVHVHRTPGALRLEVRDDGHWHRGAEAVPDELTECGRGLTIVAACAAKYGHSTTAAGTTSWAVITAS
ncbi:ATP-binding protein [Streptomyces sp. NPDC059720]|uniref:ATP-binding protein n=1 Tax=Streptomyces sp. NPDC059720 TaxID=3346924 RepID=UPI00367B24F4